MLFHSDIFPLKNILASVVLVLLVDGFEGPLRSQGEEQTKTSRRKRVSHR